MLIKMIQPTVVVDTFTYKSYVYDYFKLDKASKFLPDWWKALPRNTSELNDTMKSCVGFIDYYKYSYMCPLWAEYRVEITADDNITYEWHASDRDFSIVSHSPEQFSGLFPDEEYINIKIGSPWRIKEKSGVRFNLCSPIWNQKSFSKYTVLPGTIDAKYTNEFNIILFLRYNNNSKTIHTFNVGEPLVQFIPQTDKKVVFKHHLIGREEWIDMGTPGLSFTSRYKNIKRLVKKKEEESKCPFHNLWKK